MTTLILLHSHYDASHLAAVTAEMADRGAPTLRAIRRDESTVWLLEGCHRARAAVALGLTVELDCIDYDSLDPDAPLCDQLPGIDTESTPDEITSGMIDDEQLVECEVDC